MSILLDLYAKSRYPTPDEGYDMVVDSIIPTDGDDTQAVNKTPDEVKPHDITKPKTTRKRRAK